MKQSYYQNTERITPGAPAMPGMTAAAGITAAAGMPAETYDKPFPDYDMDIRYFTRLYPVTLRANIPAIRKVCDQLEYKGSLMFDPYPDHESMKKLALQLSQETGVDPDCIIMLLIHEFMIRRERYRTVINKR